jgi:hypothetical protein
MTDREQSVPDPISPLTDRQLAYEFNSDGQREQARRPEVYMLSYDLLSVTERERLQFVRWLMKSGRLES